MCLEFEGCVAPEPTPSTTGVISDFLGSSSLPTTPSPSITKKVKGCQRMSTNHMSSCISIGSFNDFKGWVERFSGTLVFCPFSIENPSYKNLDITTNIQLICIESGGCRIEGSKCQIRILGPRAQVFFQGFVFDRATDNAVRILQSAFQVQTFCDCHFLR